MAFTITYIHHDAFLIETDSCNILFDYWFDPTVEDEASPRFLSDIDADTPLYIFVSHFHKDHLNKVIFKWTDKFRNLRYVISKDTERHIRYLLKEDSRYAGKKVNPGIVTVIKPGETFEDDILHVKAFNSTDIGNSYAVTLRRNNLKIFHAGDLNCWNWIEESTDEEIQQARKAFYDILEPLCREYPEFDVAFFPVDSRIGSGYAEGAQAFLEKTVAKRFFPMHFALGDTALEIQQRRICATEFLRNAPGRGERIALTSPYDLYRCN